VSSSRQCQCAKKVPVPSKTNEEVALEKLNQGLRGSEAYFPRMM